jgi:hypothetical protein
MGKNFAVLDIFLETIDLKHTAGCQISTLIFGFWGDPMHIP